MIGFRVVRTAARALPSASASRRSTMPHRVDTGDAMPVFVRGRRPLPQLWVSEPQVDGVGR